MRTIFIAVTGFLVASVVIFGLVRAYREHDSSGMPSQESLAKEIAPVVEILGGNPLYVDRQLLRSVHAEVPLDEVALAEAKKIIEMRQWRYVGTVKGTYFIQHKYCRGRLSFAFEEIEKKRLSYGVTWESQPRASAYCGKLGSKNGVKAVRRIE